MVFGEKMQKRGKVSKGYSSGFVPDYPHGMDAMAVSESFGSSGRAEQELTASEDSCARERKCINLNMDDYHGFRVPTQIVSLSRMSQLERRDLEMRLKSELEQVRMFQSKMSLRSDSFVLSPASVIHINCNVPRMPASVEGFPMTTKKNSSGRNRQHSKGRAVTARCEKLVKQSASQNNNFDVLMKQCQALLKQLMKQKNAWIFNKPVDIVELKIPDYFNVIKHPMDLGTVKVKLLSHQYSSPMKFAADVRLTFKNALTYNSPGNAVHMYAVTLSKFFESRWKVIEKKISSSTDESTPSKSSIIIEPEIVSTPAKQRKTDSAENKVNQDTDWRVISDLEKQKLIAELEALLEELPENIVNFLKQSTSNESQAEADEIEIDIETLSDDTLFSLRKLLDDYVVQKKKNLTTCKIEIHDESGFSNTCMESHKADEEVGTDVNKPPPLEVDKGTVQMINKCSSSSSSSSESSSSSSDSEGSAADTDSPKDLVQVSTFKDTVASNLERKNSDINFPNDHLNGHAELNSSSSLASFEPSCYKEGETAPHDRQVSPDKLYRAAIMRSRFADIIIKAQESNLEKAERSDLQKLKLDREELERWRREEKDRLQAEARVLEEDRKKAEAEAAAKSKRKIEIEREAAREALKKMEKTVDMSSQFMEDLGMFTSAPDEHLRNSFMEGTGTENAQNGFGSFKFQASSNPLEQLGLFMKNDEEEEGVESVLGTTDDPGGEFD